jgi:dTDP-4-amino-4,6-dideoxygalactose transaminase
MKISFLDPSIEEEDIERMLSSVRSGWLKPGEYTREFEDDLAKFLDVKNTVMTSSCTASLHMSLILAGVKEGDEVITTPISYVATSNVILYQKAKPVFVDVHPDTGLIDLDKIENVITDKTKAIIPVHLYGQMVDMKKLKIIADKHDIAIVEDAAHAVESERDGIKPGQYGFSACFSFHVAKNITSGQGGAMSFNDTKHKEVASILRRDGVINTQDDKREMVMFGYKYDLTDFQAGILIGQLKRIDNTNEHRKKVFKKYTDGFKDNPNISFPKIENGVKHSCHMFIVWVPADKRDIIRRALTDAGIENSIHYEPIHLEPYYRETFKFKEGDFPIAERLGASTITLPTHAKLTDKEIDYVINTLNKLI